MGLTIGLDGLPMASEMSSASDRKATWDMRKIFGLICGLFILATPVMASAQERQTATFDIYLRGLKAAQLAFNAIEDGGRYSAAARMQSSGVMGWIRTITYEAKAQGTHGGGTLTPQLYHEERNTDGRIRTARMEYRAGVPQGRILTPPRPPRADDVDPATQGGTWDVMTAIYAVFRDKTRDQVCRLDEVLYDGRRVARLRLGSAEVDGQTIACDAEYLRVAGFSADDMAERTSFPFRLTYEQNGNGQWHVTHVTMETAYGSGRMVRR